MDFHRFVGSRFVGSRFVGSRFVGSRFVGSLPRDAHFLPHARDGTSRMTSEPPLTSQEAKFAMTELEQELNRLQRAIRLAIQDQLAKLAGRSLGSLEQNQHLAVSIHELLDSHALRVRCLECGHPAILRVSPREGSAHGVFVFDHTIDGKRTFHGGKGIVPVIRLVAKPPRKKRPTRAAG